MIGSHGTREGLLVCVAVYDCVLIVLLSSGLTHFSNFTLTNSFGYTTLSISDVDYFDYLNKFRNESAYIALIITLTRSLLVSILN